MTALPNTRNALGDSWATTGRRARRMARNSRHAAEDIASELRSLMGELEETLSDGTQADAATLRNQLRKRLDTARDRLTQTRGAVHARATDALNSADDYIHDNPWQTLAIVGSAALIVGLLLSRAR